MMPGNLKTFELNFFDWFTTTSFTILIIIMIDNKIILVYAEIRNSIDRLVIGFPDCFWWLFSVVFSQIDHLAESNIQTVALSLIYPHAGWKCWITAGLGSYNSITVIFGLI